MSPLDRTAHDVPMYRVGLGLTTRFWVWLVAHPWIPLYLIVAVLGALFGALVWGLR